tara:strand:+ start:5314 stop:5892 length:579 start_codon:yes stop_codon:yes gene_type:complete
MTNRDRKKVVKQAIEILNDGGVILYPTDTIWGIGCDANNPSAIAKVYEIKNRENKKPLIILIDDKNLLLNYVKSVPEIAEKMIDMNQVPTTIIYDDPINLPKILTYKNTIGIRVIKSHPINMLLNKFKKPLTSTSANQANYKSPVSFKTIDEHIKNEVDYIFPENFIETDSINKSSRIIKINKNSSIEVIRD